MTDDDRDFIARMDSIAEKQFGGPMSAEEITQEFALHGLKKRTVALEKMDAELRREIDSGSQNLRRRTQLMALRRKMGDLHEALRKARR